MKKLIAFVLVASILVVMMASCGKPAETTATTTTVAKVETTTKAPEATTTAAPTTTTAPETTTTATPETTTTAAPETTTVPEPEVPEVKKELVLHLDFEEANIKDGVIKNVAGEGLDAKITGEPAYVAGPDGGKAIDFSGNFSFLTIANDDRLNFKSTDEFTIELSYQLKVTASGWENLFHKGISGKGWYGVWLADSETYGVCWGGSAGNHKIGAMASDRKWHKLTIMQKNGTTHLFLDGKNVNSAVAKELISDAPLYIGGRLSGGSDTDKTQQFNGYIDDFKVYNYALELPVEGIKSADSEIFTFTAESGDSIKLPYRVYYPTDYDAEGDKKYGIVLYLHGHGSVGTNNLSQIQYNGTFSYFLDELAATNEFIIIAPQTTCDEAFGITEWIDSGYRSRPGRDPQHEWYVAGGMKPRAGALADIKYTLGLQAVSALLDEYLALDTVDKDRICVGGVSMGGCGTWELIARRPDTFAAAFPICGSGIATTASSLVDMNIWAFHGLADTTVQPDGSKNVCNAIKDAGGTKVTLSTFAGVAHNVEDNAFTTKNAAGQTLTQWLTAQRKGK